MITNVIISQKRHVDKFSKIKENRLLKGEWNKTKLHHLVTWSFILEVYKAHFN